MYFNDKFYWPYMRSMTVVHLIVEICLTEKLFTIIKDIITTLKIWYILCYIIIMIEKECTLWLLSKICSLKHATEANVEKFQLIRSKLFDNSTQMEFLLIFVLTHEFVPTISFVLPQTDRTILREVHMYYPLMCNCEISPEISLNNS